MSIYVLFWFDVEDYIEPQSDEALKGLLEAFEAHGVQATWKLVGEKARVLERRGRGDIIRLLQRQDIGYHTDYHSVHPVLAEYLEHMGWEDGIAELRRRVMERHKVATTLGYGPRFLHSTGQLHKGGPNKGLFLQLSADEPELAIPGESYGFGTLAAAQAMGDFQALTTAGRRAVRIVLGADAEGGLLRLLAAL